MAKRPSLGQQVLRFSRSGHALLERVQRWEREGKKEDRRRLLLTDLQPVLLGSRRLTNQGQDLTATEPPRRVVVSGVAGFLEFEEGSCHPRQLRGTAPAGPMMGSSHFGQPALWPQNRRQTSFIGPCPRHRANDSRMRSAFVPLAVKKEEAASETSRWNRP